MSAAGGKVNDTQGFASGETATFIFPNGTEETGTITVVDATTLTVTGLSTTPGPGTGVLARRSLNGGARIDGIFQANFRNGDRRLIAAAGDTFYELPAFGAGGHRGDVCDGRRQFLAGVKAW